MNIMFWVMMILMLLVAIGLLVFPVLRARQSSSLAYKESNLTINDEKVKELDLDLAEGRIDQSFYRVAREELDRELLIDIPVESKETAAIHYTGTAKRHPALALMIAMFLPLLAMFLYLDLGMHHASEENFVLEQQQKTQPPSVEKMMATLEEKIEKEGGTVEEWIMMGRAHKYQGDNKQAANAFAVALEKGGDNAQLMLERAEVLALDNDRRFNEESRALITKAYELEPDNANSLWFIGVAEFQQEQYKQAIAYLVKLLPLARGDQDVIKSVIGVVAKSRQALIDSGEEMPELATILGIEAMKSDVAEKPLSPMLPATDSMLSLIITVDVSDQVKQSFNASDVVFVYAKAKQGPRLPLAVQRLTLNNLPTTITLDDSMAMVEGMKISAFKQLQVSARITKSGSAIAQSGDYIGQRDVEPESSITKLNIMVDTVVP